MDNTFLRRLYSVTAIVCLLCLGAGELQAHEFSGYVGGEARLFPNDPIHPGQEEQSGSFFTAPEYYHEWKGGSSFVFAPFYRYDSADSERTHFDVRELTFLWLHDDFEFRFGARKVFWGQTEVLHLVDIINQTDLVENIDTEDKLGQPMLNLSFARDWGTVDLFFLPFFRERTFPGRDGRLRAELVVDTDREIYESSLDEYHPDAAVRYSHFIGDWDVGVAHFRGTGREPTLLMGKDSSGNSVLIPFYEQINQTSLDALYAAGSWLWKFEGLYRIGQHPEDYFAATGGFEYTLSGFMGTGMDLGGLVEWMYDDRGDRATTPFENDVVGGVRLAVNDIASTEFLFGFLQDLNSESNSLFVEASRRFGDHWKLNAELRFILEQETNDFLYALRDDDLFQLELLYYF